MAIHLNQPYKISPNRQKRYESHYGIPAADVVVIPMRELGEEVSCDIRWEDNNGQLHVVEHSVFVKDNLVPLDQMRDMKGFELWKHYYNRSKNDQ
jgi:hypothetical protein